jgi:hypothetical protein
VIHQVAVIGSPVDYPSEIQLRQTRAETTPQRSTVSRLWHFFSGQYSEALLLATSSGGWGSSVNTFSERNQRSGVQVDAGRDTWEDRGGPLADEFTKGPMETEVRFNINQRAHFPDVQQGNRSKPPKTGLIDQSTSGGDLKNEMQDARQGRDDRWPSGTGDDIGA